MNVFNFNLSSNKCDDMIVAREASVTIPGYKYVELCKGDKSDQKATEKLQSIRPVVQCKSNPNRDAISKKQVNKREKKKEQRMHPRMQVPQPILASTQD